MTFRQIEIYNKFYLAYQSLFITSEYLHGTIYLQSAAWISTTFREDHGDAVLLDTLYCVSAGLKGKSRLLLLDF